jgi:signal transduction histidine kinase
VVDRLRAIIYDLPRQEATRRAAPLSKRLVAIVDSLTQALHGIAPTMIVLWSVDALGGTNLADDLEAALREALTNIAKHAHATVVAVRITAEAGLLILDVIDNGVGLRAGIRSSGQANLRRRAHAHHGELIYLPNPTGGTHLRWTARPPSPG